jgi:hypothetical protein
MNVRKDPMLPAPRVLKPEEVLQGGSGDSRSSRRPEGCRGVYRM